MTVEMFERGTNFKVHIRNFWNVTQIKLDSGKYILIYAGKTKIDILNAEKFELRIS